jgi:hypothetical protein
MNDLEQRLQKLKPKINRDLRLELLQKATVSRQPSARSAWGKYLLACSCSFLLGLAVMYGVMKPSISREPQASPPVVPVKIEEKPSQFFNETIAEKPKEVPAKAESPKEGTAKRPRTLAGNDSTYLSLLKKYQTP